MKNFLISLLLIASLFLFAGCTKPVHIEEKVVQAEIISTDYTAPYITTVFTGKTFIPVSHPADYDLVVKYEDIVKNFDISESDYMQYKDCVGQTISAKLIVSYYDNGKTKQRLELYKQ